MRMENIFREYWQKMGILSLREFWETKISVGEDTVILLTQQPSIENMQKIKQNLLRYYTIESLLPRSKRINLTYLLSRYTWNLESVNLVNYAINIFLRKYILPHYVVMQVFGLSLETGLVEVPLVNPLRWDNLAPGRRMDLFVKELQPRNFQVWRYTISNLITPPRKKACPRGLKLVVHVIKSPTAQNLQNFDISLIQNNVLLHDFF